MAAGNICICHDNEYNRETTGSGMIYFQNEKDLAEKIRQVESMSDDLKEQFAVNKKTKRETQAKYGML